MFEHLLMAFENMMTRILGPEADEINTERENIKLKNNKKNTPWL
jgi:hypothetical protein